MGRPSIKTRLLIAKDDIVKFFDNSQSKIFDLKFLTDTLVQNGPFWRLGNISRWTFIEFLIEKTKLKKEIFVFPHRRVARYTWGDISLYELLLTLKSKSFYSHYSAMYFHHLTDQIPKTIYINHEQGPKPQYDTELAQERIDIAFSRKTRLSNTIGKYNEYNFYLLNGMFTGNTGVIDASGPEDSKIRMTNIERTLIDIAVRPEYAGGPHEVLRAYKNSANLVSINKLCAMLKNIGYLYPYHQVIGFYVDTCGVYQKTQVDLLRKQEIRFDFYLMHNMKEKKYSEKWKLFYPKGLA
jgi:predicted transcriptional regulator of viral defense system